jgi:hypothetical protein
VPSPPTLTGKVPDPPAPKKGSPISSSPSPCPPCSTSSPMMVRRAGHRQTQSRKSPWSRSTRAGHGSQKHRAAGAESQLGHGPPRPNVVVGRTRTLCSSELPRARVAAQSSVGSRAGFDPLAFVLFFYFPNGFKTLQPSKICASLV